MVDNYIVRLISAFFYIALGVMEFPSPISLDFPGRLLAERNTHSAFKLVRAGYCMANEQTAFSNI